MKMIRRKSPAFPCLGFRVTMFQPFVETRGQRAGMAWLVGYSNRWWFQDFVRNLFFLC